MYNSTHNKSLLRKVFLVFGQNVSFFIMQKMHKGMVHRTFFRSFFQ